MPTHTRTNRSVAAVSAFLLVSATGAFAQENAPPPPPDPTAPLPAVEFMERDAEIALAQAAAPAPVSDHATIWVLGPSGFETAVEGTNGWGCLVQRDAAGTGLFPRCDDASSVATNFETFFLLEEIRASGGSMHDYRTTLAEGLRTGVYRAPPAGALSYMYADGPIPPHMMVMKPFCTPDDIGVSSPEEAQGHVMGLALLNPGQPSCHLVIFTPENTRRSGGGRP